jgi:hypothetical protein
MDLDLPVQVVLFYFAVAGFFVGWAFPRGKYLKAFQLRLLKMIHNFFADEEEYIAHKAERLRKRVRRKS